VYHGHNDTIRSWLGVKASVIFSRPPTTAPYGFGNQRRHAAFKCSGDTRSALSTRFGPSTTDLSFRATAAVRYDGGQLTEYDASMDVSPDGCLVPWMADIGDSVLGMPDSYARWRQTANMPL